MRIFEQTLSDTFKQTTPSVKDSDKALKALTLQNLEKLENLCITRPNSLINSLFSPLYCFFCETPLLSMRTFASNDKTNPSIKFDSLNAHDYKHFRSKN